MSIQPAGHIFLSYSTSDADFALKLAADLKNAGVRLWMDRLDGITVGMQWRRAIQEAVNDCAAMLALLSKNYVNSEYCMKELARANALGRAVFPLRLHQMDAKLWPLALEGVQYEDFSGWRDGSFYSDRVGRLLHTLQNDFAGQIGPAPDAEEQYLTTLIVDLESIRGVQEYVALSGVASEFRPKPAPDDEWGFAELLEPAQHGDDAQTIPLESIAQAVAKYPRLVLLGAPGGGKTTTIRRLALDTARVRLQSPHGCPLPVFLPLSQWRDEPTFADFLATRWRLPRAAMGILETDDVVLYLDGLNEMGGDGPQRAGHLKEWLDSTAGGARVIVTCRQSDYTERLSLGSIPKVVVEELKLPQIQHFATNYLKGRADPFLQLLGGASSEPSRSLIGLARNPYMLAALTYLYDATPGGQLPRNMGDLFRRLLRALWKRERQRATSLTSDYEEAETAFGGLALAAIEGNLPETMPLTYALGIIGSADLLQLGVAANVFVASDESVRFYHQLIREYFGAVGLRVKSVEEVVARLEKPEYFGTINSRGATRWDNTVVALCGLYDDTTGLIKALTEFDRELAGVCLLSEFQNSEALHSTFVLRLVNDLSDRNGWVRFVAARTLRHFPEPAAIPALSSALADHWGNPYYDVVSDYAKEALAKIGTSDALDALSRAPKW